MKESDNTARTVTDDIESGQQQCSKDRQQSNELDLEENDNKLTIPCRRSHVASRSVSATCAICLEEYKAGETIAWSSNPACIHCFHEDCFVEALATRPKETEERKPLPSWPCPVCRQCFVTTASAASSTDASAKIAVSNSTE